MVGRLIVIFTGCLTLMELYALCRNAFSSSSVPLLTTPIDSIQPHTFIKYNTTNFRKERFLPDHLQNVSQDDPELIAHILEHWLLPPSDKPRVLRRPNKVYYSQREQSQFVDKILNNRTGGFYIECGALDGERFSNSLFFEVSRNWSGLLIEANDGYFASLLSRKRHAYLVNAAVSPLPRSTIADFAPALALGGLTDLMSETHQKRIGRLNRYVNNTLIVQCLPLYSILQAINVSHVDYFSLDIEGAEVDVLKTLPLDKITVDVFSIEYVVGDPRSETETKRKLKEICDYLVERHDYEVVFLDEREDVILKKKSM